MLLYSGQPKGKGCQVKLDKPICRPDQKKIYGVARNEAAEILCQVDAYPPPESFKWSFNNTAETIDMPQSGYRVHAEQASSLTYTPVKELDYGTIMCWADNVVGQQKEPCVFHLIAAGKPEMPYNCSLVNQTSESLEVDCAEGNYFTIICLSHQLQFITHPLLGGRLSSH
uniref:Ig-like domain-containing protein n=1 Tax=Anopheles stephensi TaxID=30069 RepID=A0A182XVB0_ANOST